MLNDSALRYWNYTGYTRDDILSVMKELDDKVLAAMVDFQEDGTIRFAITTIVEERRAGHFPTMLRFVKEISDIYGAGKLRGSLVLWLEDGMWDWHAGYAQRVPILAFGRKTYDQCTMLIPDPAFLGSQGYQKDIEEINEVNSGIPWESKAPVVFWRGASSGVGLDGECWKNVARIALCIQARNIADRNTVDIALSKVIDFNNPEHGKRIHDLGIVKEPVPFTDFLKYRYQVDADGFACAWMSLFLKLASRCSVLKVESDNIQWYYDKLRPWVHYIPLRPDASNLGEIVDWVMSHEDECRYIASTAGSLMESINYFEASRETMQLFAAVLQCQKA